MDIQHALLSKIILGGELRLAVNGRITTEFFTDDRYARIYSYLLDHWQQYGTAPDEAVVLAAFPTQEWEVHPQPIEYFIDRLRERRRRSILTEGLNEAATHFQSADPDSTELIAESMRNALTRAYLETSQSFDLDFSDRREELMARLLDRMENPGYLRGISTGFPGIDYVTGGLQAQHFIALIGTIKSFKSATLLAMALAVHKQAKVPLFLGFEMSNVEQEDRLMSLISGVSLTKVMNGTFSAPEEKRIDRALVQLEAMRAFILSSDITSGTTVSGVQAKIQEYAPDVVFIDGAYMMQSELPNVLPGSPQALTDISRSLKRLAQRSKIPIIITTQASFARSKGGLSGHSAAYTQAWGQDCDVLMGVERLGERKADETAADPVNIKFKVIESRSGPRKEVVLEWNWHRGSVTELDPAAMKERLDRSSGKPSYATDDGTEKWHEPT